MENTSRRVSVLFDAVAFREMQFDTSRALIISRVFAFRVRESYTSSI